MSRPAKYIPGDLVFAKVKGYPSWPARVTSCKSSRYKVFFYGTFETATVKKEEIWPYSQENVDKFAPKNLKRKGYIDGLDQIKNTPEIAPVEGDGFELETSASYNSSLDVNRDAYLVTDETSKLKSKVIPKTKSTSLTSIPTVATLASVGSTKRKAVDSSSAAPPVKRFCIENSPENHKKTSPSRNAGVVHVEDNSSSIKRKAVDSPSSATVNKRKALDMLGTALPAKRPSSRSVESFGKTKKLSKIKKLNISKVKVKKALKKSVGVRDEREIKLDFELAKPVVPSGFQMFGTPPVFKLRKEHFQMSLLEFYREVLQPLFELYPAIIGRPLEPVDPPDLSELYNLKVIPKDQVITNNKNGVGSIRETKSKPTTVGEFIRSANKSPTLQTDMDEKFFATDLIKTKYLNDIENFKIPVNGGWDLEKEDLGLGQFGPMSGINTVWNYVSYPNSASPIHNEDQNFCSVNLQHIGDDKVWYCFKQEDTEAISKVAAKLLPMQFDRCEAYLNHKEIFLNPGIIAKNYNFDVFKLVQTPGDFVFTAPGVLHSIWNKGISINSATNFFPDDPKSAKVIQSKKQCSKKCLFKEKSLNLPIIKLDLKLRRCLNEGCDKKYASEHGLYQHMPKCRHGTKNVTVEALPKIQCPFCPKIVKKLGVHLDKWHDDQKSTPTCPLCGIEMKEKELKIHLQKCRQCQDCGKTFFRSRKKALEHFCLKKHNLI